MGLESKTAAQAKLEASLSKQQATAEGLERQVPEMWGRDVGRCVEMWRKASSGRCDLG